MSDLPVATGDRPCPNQAAGLVAAGREAVTDALAAAVRSGRLPALVLEDD